MDEDTNSDGFLILEERHMISIIMYLGANDGCKKTDLYRNISKNPRMPEKLDALQSAGLIVQELEGVQKTRLFLTPMGKQVYKKLIDIGTIMS